MNYLYNGIYFYDKEGVIKTCEELYGDKYDLSEFLTNGIKYSTSTDKTLIPVICKKHGKINISIGDLLSGIGCHKCIRDRRNDIRCAFNISKIMYAENRTRYKKSDLQAKIFSIYGNTIRLTDIKEYKNIDKKI